MFAVKELWLIDIIFGASHMIILVIIGEIFLQSDDFSNLLSFANIDRIYTKSLYTTPLCVLPYSHICHCTKK